MTSDDILMFREKLRQVERQMVGQLKDETVCCGVTLSQCHIIMEIGKRNETSLVDLAAVLGVDTSTLSRNINGMVNIGLVNREVNPEDRRYVSVTLTEQGRKVYQFINDECNSFYMKIFSYIPEDKHEQVMESFVLFADAMVRVQGMGVTCNCCGDAGCENN